LHSGGAGVAENTSVAGGVAVKKINLLLNSGIQI
jgi:hypothetical protein